MRKKGIGLVSASLIWLGLTATSNAGVMMSTNKADFILTPEAFPTTILGTNNDIVSVSGSLRLDNAEGVGNPATGTHGYEDFNPVMPGTEYVLNGDENFDVFFSTPQRAFAMDYLDDSLNSVFMLEFLNNSTLVGVSAFVSQSPFDTVKFVGFTSTETFNQVRIRETDMGNTNEFFQFYSAQPVPEPASLAIFGLGTLGVMGAGARRKRKKTS